MFVLKQLRRKKKINQTDLARVIGVSLRTIQLYEKKNANIPIKNLTKIADYFGVTIAELYSNEVNEDGGNYTSKSKDYSHLVKPIDTKKSILTIPLVTRENHAQYCEQFENQDFLNELPTLSFMIGDSVQGNYLAFETLGDSMENGKADSIPNGSIVLGKEVLVENLGILAYDKSPKIVLIYAKRILCKEMTEYDEKNKTITCHSLNISPEYADFEVALEGVKQIFEVIKKQTD